jgi:hypothetical protein
MRASIPLVAVAFVAATFATAGSVRANLLANPGFENPSTAPGVEYFGAPGWSDFGGGTYTINNVVEPNTHGGVQTLKTFGGTSGVFQQFPAAPGQTWDASAWILNSSLDQMSGAQIAAVNIEWHTAAPSGSFISFTGSGDVTAASPANTWIQKSVSAVAPANTAFARIVLITGAFTGPGGGAPRFDDASFAQAVVPEPATLGVLGAACAGLLARRRRTH